MTFIPKLESKTENSDKLSSLRYKTGRYNRRVTENNMLYWLVKKGKPNKSMSSCNPENGNTKLVSEKTETKH